MWKNLSAFVIVALGFQSVAISKTTVMLNWKAEPEFGGFYAAQTLGFFKEEGLDVLIQEGGVGAPVEQRVATGKIEFGVSNADDMVISRDRGTDLVALFAVYQKSPKAFMAQKSRGLKTIQDGWNSGTIAAQEGTPQFAFLTKKYGKPKAKVVPQLGGISQIKSDKNMLQECFATAEPVFATKSGVMVDTFPIANEGYNPYYTVVIARAQFVKKNPEVVAKFLRAVRKGWEAYIKDPKATNVVMQKLNPTFTAEAMDEIAAVQIPFIEVKPSAQLGSMEEARFTELATQLKDIGLIKKVLPASSYISK